MARNGVVMKYVSAERAGAFELIKEADQGYGNRVSVDTISRRNDKIGLGPGWKSRGILALLLVLCEGTGAPQTSCGMESVSANPDHCSRQGAEDQKVTSHCQLPSCSW